ncbi:MAG: hypothetical protein M1833_001813 [Piccolia ochrophora]|nr:MAG: hypothetical protein M1833_001813 [Piccolia ochrophora]
MNPQTLPPDSLELLEPFFEAVDRGDQDRTEAWLGDAEFDPNCQDKAWRSALLIASCNGHDALVRSLLARNDLDPNITNVRGNTALHYTSKPQVADALLQDARIASDVSNRWGTTPLLAAAKNGHTCVVQRLLARDDVALNRQDRFGNTALILAAIEGHPDVVRCLLDQRYISVNIANKLGMTALVYAAQSRDTAMVRLLLAHPDVDVNRQNNENDTALHIATFQELPAIVQALLERTETDANLVNDRGWTALHHAVTTQHLQIIEFFKNARDLTSRPVRYTTRQDLQHFVWSGKERDMEYKKGEEPPLQYVDDLGNGRAIVDRVACGSVHLARKKIRISETSFSDSVQNEMNVLRKLRHSHVIQIVGTYRQALPYGMVEFGILIEPAAQVDLKKFLTFVGSRGPEDESVSQDIIKIRMWFSCLASAITFLHESKIRHKDIKPDNVLVNEWSIIVTDFDISKDFEEQTQSKSTGPTPKTRRYCAPEVANYDGRGRAADVYSLGCVYLEMMSVVAGKSMVDVRDYFGDEYGEDAFHENPDKVASWIVVLKQGLLVQGELHVYHLIGQRVCDVIGDMLSLEPQQRPWAGNLFAEVDGLSSVICSTCHPQMQEKEEAFTHAGTDQRKNSTYIR